MCVSLQRRAIQNSKMYVLLQRRAQKCMNPAHNVRGQPAAYKNHHFTTVSDIWPARSDERVAPSTSKFAFHHSFGRPMSTKRREGCESYKGRFAFHLSFGRPTSTKWREGCDEEVQTSHFTTVLDVRRARSDERVATAIYKIRISPQFWTSDEHEVTRGLRGPCSKFAFHHSFGRPTSTKWREGGLPSWSTKPTLRKKKKEILKKSWSTAILSRSSQQIFSAQLFSADLLSRSSQHSHSQQIFSAISTAILSRSSQHSHSQQIFSAQPFSADLLSYQLWSAILSRSSQLSCCCGQGLVVSYCLSYHVAVVRGWWSAIVWSAIVLSFAVVRGWWSAIVWSAIVLSFAVVRGWWSAIVLSCWWSILHEFFRRTLSRSFREKTPHPKAFCSSGQGSHRLFAGRRHQHLCTSLWQLCLETQTGPRWSLIFWLVQLVNHPSYVYISFPATIIIISGANESLLKYCLFQRVFLEGRQMYFFDCPRPILQVILQVCPFGFFSSLKPLFWGMLS